MSFFGLEYRQYLPVSDRDRQWGLYVTGAGHSTVEVVAADRREEQPPDGHWRDAEHGRRLSEYAVVYVSRGQGHFESEAIGKRTVSAGTVMLIFPGVWHQYFASAKIGWTEYWVTFSGGYADLLVQREFISPQEPVLETSTDGGVLRPFLRLLDRVKSEPLGLQQLIAADTMEILGAVLAADRARQSGAGLSGVVRQATLVLQQHVVEYIDMEELADSLHISYSRFRHAFKQQTGMAPHQYHLQLRINRAKELLRETSCSVKEIATTLGFNDQFHFSKAFKRHTKVSPTQWRG